MNLAVALLVAVARSDEVLKFFSLDIGKNNGSSLSISPALNQLCNTWLIEMVYASSLFLQGITIRPAPEKRRLHSADIDCIVRKSRAIQERRGYRSLFSCQ